MYQLLMRFLSPCVLVVLFALPFASSAPTALDPSALLQNGIAAQQLNAEFLTLKATDSCNSSDIACVSGLPAQCSKMGAWKTEKCPGGKSKSCFALPLVRANGTFLACTSKADALSIISATGSQGGITGDGHATSGSSNGNSTAPDNGSTVTVTLAVPAGSSVTLPPATRTIGSSEASSILSILAADATPSSPTAAASPANTAGAAHIKLTASATAHSSSTGANTKTATSSS